MNNIDNQIIQNTRIALRINNKLSVDQFILVNEEIFVKVKNNNDCFCGLNNTFIYLNNKGVRFALDELIQFYNYSCGKHKNCTKLIDTISNLSLTKEIQLEFQNLMKVKLNEKNLSAKNNTLQKLIVAINNGLPLQDEAHLGMCLCCGIIQVNNSKEADKEESKKKN